MLTGSYYPFFIKILLICSRIEAPLSEVSSPLGSRERACERAEGAAKRIGIRGGGGNSEGDASEGADARADGGGGVGVILFSQPDSSVYSSALPSLPSLPPPPNDVCWLSVCMSAFPFHFTS